LKRYATTLIIWASLLLSELHTFWENSTQTANWILTKRVEMVMQWNVKYATDEAWFVLMALALLVYEKNRINLATVKSYLVFTVCDVGMYFYNYKQEGYEWMYLILLITWIIFYNGKRSRPKDRQGITFEAQR